VLQDYLYTNTHSKLHVVSVLHEVYIIMCFHYKNCFGNKKWVPKRLCRSQVV